MSSILTHPNVNRQESFVINPHRILQLHHLVQPRRYTFMGHEYLLFSIFYTFRPSWPSSRTPFNATKSLSKSLRILKRITRNTDQPTYSVVESSSSGANRSSADRVISRILWNTKVYYRFHNSPLPVPILSQIDLVYVPSLFSKIHFNIIFSSTPGYSK